MSLHLSAQQFSETNGAVMSFAGHCAVLDSRVADETLLERFNADFVMLPADSIERIRTAQRIRHQVYCVEHPHETSNDPDGLEMDEFDSHAAQSLLVYRTGNRVLGTLRLILPLKGNLEHSFPVQRVMAKEHLAEFNRLPLHAMGEVSRFSISRQFRRVADTRNGAEQAALTGNSGALMRLGLMQALVRMSLQHGITHWCAAVEPTLWRMFEAMAIRFHPIGPLVEYHGMRQPCYGVIADVLNAVRRERPSFWAVLTDNGTFGQRASPARGDVFKPELVC